MRRESRRGKRQQELSFYLEVVHELQAAHHGGAVCVIKD